MVFLLTLALVASTTPHLRVVCEAPRIVVEGGVDTAWSAPLDSACRQLHAFSSGELDREAVVVVKVSAPQVLVAVTLTDGRIAQRRVTNASLLMPTLEALLLMPRLSGASAAPLPSTGIAPKPHAERVADVEPAVHPERSRGAGLIAHNSVARLNGSSDGAPTAPLANAEPAVHPERSRGAGLITQDRVVPLTASSDGAPTAPLANAQPAVHPERSRGAGLITQDRVVPLTASSDGAHTEPFADAEPAVHPERSRGAGLITQDPVARLTGVSRGALAEAAAATEVLPGTEPSPKTPEVDTSVAVPGEPTGGEDKLTPARMPLKASEPPPDAPQPESSLVRAPDDEPTAGDFASRFELGVDFGGRLGRDFAVGPQIFGAAHVFDFRLGAALRLDLPIEQPRVPRELRRPQQLIVELQAARHFSPWRLGLDVGLSPRLGIALTSGALDFRGGAFARLGFRIGPMNLFLVADTEVSKPNPSLPVGFTGGLAVGAAWLAR